ncbi:MAG: tRNA (adenosine(37)-N6)-threonylcarbamoyltransferase complex transferase subunit TsaD [Patescibacteria group bacterium]|nr:tRNA (adenosine(37)-N6)-threonylcarbamoyltransferase complex transferase subunit TsaD [Patescibacteria group bacterium]
MNEPLILSIDTSCDETSAALSAGRRVLSNVISSQISIHQKYGGVFPALAKRAHEEKIDCVVREALKRGCGWEVGNESGNEDEKWGKSSSSSPLIPDSQLTSHPQIIAVTYGPGLAIALEVGIKKAKELVQRGLKSATTRLPLIAVNHLEGHLYSCLAQNKNGKPEREITFPAIGLIVSGGHTELVLMKNHGEYQVLGATLDDACGEALDKAAKILHLGYPGGPIIERLAENVNRKQQTANCQYFLTPPLKEKNNLNFSYSGLKTQFLYLTQKMTEEELGKNLTVLAKTFQEAAFEQVLRKTSQAIEVYQPKTLLCGGGVIANHYLRQLLRKLAKQNHLPIFFPANKKLITDNAAMIGIAAWYKYQRNEFVEDLDLLDRKPRLSL